MNRFLMSTLGIAGIASIVMAAIVSNALEWLILGVLILCGLVVLLANIGVGLFTKAAPFMLKRDTLRYDQDLKMIDRGFMPLDKRYQFVPQLTAPDEHDIPVSTQGVTSQFVSEHLRDAVELLALSKLDMGEYSDQIVPYYKARKNPYFSDVAVWMQAVQVLLVNRVAVERYKEGPKGRKKLGTFLITGTVGQAYQELKQMLPNPPAG